MIRNRKIVTKTKTCPDCGETVTYQDRKGVRRFRPKVKRCDNCGEVFR